MTALARQGIRWSTTGLKLILESDQQANGTGLHVALGDARVDVAFLHLRWRQPIARSMS